MDFQLSTVILSCMSIFTIILFFAILLVLVIVHEFGHFIMAKWTNMRVDEFAFGFPPKLYSKKKGETTYSINALPFGGYVSIWGENGSEEDKLEGGAKHHPRAFGNRPWWAQLLVLVAGVVMNMFLAWVIFVGISYGKIDISASDEFYGSRIKDTSLMVVDSSPDSPAFRAGIVPGVTILKITTGKDVAHLTDATSLINFVLAHNNDPFTITYKKTDGEIANTTIAAVYGIVPDKKAIGISVDQVGTFDANLLDAIRIGSLQTYNITEMTVTGLTSLFKSLTNGENVMSSLSGPIGIARIVGQTSEYGYKAVLTLVAVLSINLAIFNALPLPALDGGRMVVVIIEAVIRRKIPHKYYSWVNVIGFVLLMLLLVFVTVHDIRR